MVLKQALKTCLHSNAATGQIHHIGVEINVVRAQKSNRLILMSAKGAPPEFNSVNSCHNFKSLI
jgi:hypothetical protein